MTMKLNAFIRTNFIILGLAIISMSCSQNIQTTSSSKKRIFLNSHADIRDTLTTYRSEVVRAAKILKSQLPDADLVKKSQDIYNDIAANIDGFVSRYETVIDNPVILKDQTSAINERLSSISRNIKNFREFYNKEYLNKPTMGETTADAPLWANIAETAYKLGKQLIEDIQKANSTIRAGYKEEARNFKLPDWESL